MKKRCTKCGVEKDISEFPINREKKDGKNYRCKDCYKEYYRANKERITKRSKDYYRENKERILEGCKDHYKENREKRLKQQKEYSKKNKECLVKYRKNIIKPQMG